MTIKIFISFAVLATTFALIAVTTSCRQENIEIDTFTVESGDLVQTVTASGFVDSSQKKNYSLEKSGEIISILETGEKFSEGDILVEVDNTRAEILYRQAEENLKLAQSSIDIAKINYQHALDANHVAVQLAELNTELSRQQTQSALRSLEDANGLARASAEAAIVSIENAERYLEELKDTPFATDAQIAQAEGSLDSAEAAYDTTVSSQRSQTDAAEGAYQQSQTNESVTYWSNLSNLQAAQTQIKLTYESIVQAEKQLGLSEINLELSAMELDNDIIHAPFDGIVFSSAFTVGELGAPGISAISVISDKYLIKVDINETDISKLEVGQPVEITLDAYPDLRFNGTVSYISPLSKNIANIITFEVEITPDDELSQYLLHGISASVTITTSESEDVLYIPIEAVYEENDKKFVDVLTSSEYTIDNIKDFIKKVEVTTGDYSYDFIEIKSGLKPGDIVILSRIEDIINQQQDSGAPQGGFFG